MRKAVSPIIATVLILVMTISAAALAFIWYNSIQSGIQESIGGNLEGGFRDCSAMKLLSFRGDKATIQNNGCDTIDSVTLLIDGVLTNYDLDAPIAPGSVGTITFAQALAADEDYCIEVFLPNSQSDILCSYSYQNTEDAGFVASCNSAGDCNDNNVCTDNTCVNSTCTYVDFSNGQYAGCTSSTGCTGTSPVICACTSGSCIDTCGDDTCQSWENSSTCSADCAVSSCSEGSCSLFYYTMFSGTVTSSDYANCPCCGDDKFSDVFYNSTTLCSYGGLVTDYDSKYIEDWYADNKNYSSAKGVCELHSYAWLSNTLLFDEEVSLGTVTNGVSALFIGDIDSDNDLDIVTGSSNGDVSKWVNDGAGGFTKTILTPGINWRITGLVLGDFDSDNDLDIATVNSTFMGGTDLYIWTNNGAGTFTPNFIAHETYQTYDLAAADIDNDGDMDLVSPAADPGGSYGEWYVWFNQGSLNFDYEIYSGEYLSSAFGDFDNDGNIDLAIGQEYPTINIMLNNGTGGFSGGGYSISNNWITSDVAIGDLDKDGDNDFLVTTGTSSSDYGKLTKGINNGAASFTTSLIDSKFQQGFGDILLIDYDNDADLDIAVSGPDGLRIYTNDGAGTFYPSSIIGAGGILGAGDFDNDGDLDIIEAGSSVDLIDNLAISGANGPCCGDDAASDTFNNGTAACSSGSYSIVNGDSSQGNCDTYNTYGEKTTWFTGSISGTGGPCCGDDISENFNNGTLLKCINGVKYYETDSSQSDCNTYFNAWFSGSVTGANGPCCGDDGVSEAFYNSTQKCSGGGIVYNNDALYTFDTLGDKINSTSGKYVCNQAAKVWFLNNASYQAMSIISDSSYPEDSRSGDFNEDGYADFVTASSFDLGILYYESYGNGSLKPRSDFIYGSGQVNFLDVGDVNNDGHLDVVAADDYTFLTFLGDGTGSFGSYIEKSPAGNGFLLLGDFNKDKKLDVIQSADFDISYYQGYGNGSFMEGVIIPSLSGPDSMAAGDFNTDGSLDIVTIDNDGINYFFSLFAGNGDGTFDTYVSYPVVGDLYFLTSGDVNNDGYLDVITYSGSWISTFLGYGDGDFADALLMSTSVLTDMHLSDVNNDGNLDLLPMTSSAWYYFKGNGDGTFSNTATYSSSGLKSITTGDLDADGDLDVFVTSRDSSYVRAYKNIGITGTGGPCCETGDTFSNSTNTCTNGVFS